MAPGIKAKGWTRSCGAEGAEPHPRGSQTTSFGSGSSPVLPSQSSAAPAGPTAQGTPSVGHPGVLPPSLGAPIPGDTGDPHPTSWVPSGTPTLRSSTPTSTPRWGGPAGSGFGEMGRVSMATERDDDSRHGEAAWPGPLPWRCAWHSESPWRWPRDGAVPMAWGPGLGWDGGTGVSRGLSPPTPRAGPRRCRRLPGAASCPVPPPPPGIIFTRLFHSSSHSHLTGPTSHFQSNHSTALIAHANMQIRIN